jgi:hypothetical protein
MRGLPRPDRLTAASIERTVIFAQTYGASTPRGPKALPRAAMRPWQSALSVDPAPPPWLRFQAPHADVHGARQPRSESFTTLERQHKAGAESARVRSITLQSLTSRYSELHWSRNSETRTWHVSSLRGQAVERHEPGVEWARHVPVKLHYAAGGGPRTMESIGPAQTSGSKKYPAPDVVTAPGTRSSVTANLDSASTERLTEEVIRRVDKRMRIERERRGL